MDDGRVQPSPGTAAGAVALEQVAFLGPFFAVAVAGPTGTGLWRPLGDLLNDPEVLGERIAATRAVLATRCGEDVSYVEPKVAASTVQLGLSARLLSPAVAAALLTGWLPLLTGSTLWWRAGDSDPVGLSVECSLEARYCAGAEELVDALDEQLLRGLAGPLVEATQAAVAVSPLVLWGNVASAVHTAVTLTVLAQPSREQLGREMLGGLMSRPLLAGTAEAKGRTRDGARRFRRNSCCLRYRLPDVELCGDCVLLTDST
ncbi:MAG: (2Fe-2S)-binding protein [Nocardioidaceae bacterium]